MKDLEETIIRKMDSAKVRELATMLMAYTESGNMNDKLIRLFEI